MKGLSASTAQASTLNLETCLLIKFQSNTLFTQLFLIYCNALLSLNVWLIMGYWAHFCEQRKQQTIAFPALNHSMSLDQKTRKTYTSQQSVCTWTWAMLSLTGSQRLLWACHSNYLHIKISAGRQDFKW